MKEISDSQIVVLFRKYEKELFDTLSKKFKEGTDLSNLDKEGVLDELFCHINEPDVMEDLYDNVWGSVGWDTYGVEESPDED